MSDDDRSYSEDESEDVAQVVELLRRVHMENSELKRNFESLKGLHVQLSSSHQQLESQHAALYEERVSVERQYQGLCESWRTELEDKHRSLEAAKAQVLRPKDLELIKIKLLDELEGPYKQKCEQLEKEAQSSHEQLLALRREHEELVAVYKSLDLRTSSEAELQAADHIALVTQLKDKLAELANPQAKLTAAEAQLRTLERERDGLAFNLAKMQTELADVRRQKERAVVEKESVSFKVERKVKDIQAEELKLNGLVESLTRKNRHLQKELADALRANEEQFGHLMKAQAERVAMQEQLEALKKSVTAEKMAYTQQYEDTIHRLEDKLDGVRKEVHDRERQVAELHISHQEQVSRLVEAHDVRLSEFEAEAAEKARQGREARNELQAKLEALQDVCEEYRRECEEFKRKETSRAAAAQRDVDRLQAAAGESERTAVNRSQEVQSLKKDLDTLRAEANAAELRAGHLQQRKEELDAQVSRLQEEAKAAASKQQTLSKELDDARRVLEGEKVAALTHMEAARKATALEKAALAKKYQSNLHELTAHHEEYLKRVRKKLKAAHREIAALTDEVTDLRFRSHDLQALADATSGGSGGGGGQAAGGFGGARNVGGAERLGGGLFALGKYGGGGGGGEAGVGVQAGVGASMLANMAALRDRQDEYLSAAAGKLRA